MFNSSHNYLSSEEEYYYNNTSFLNNKEFNLYKDNLLYKIKLIIEQEKLILKSFNYEIKLNKDELSELFNIQFKTINDAFKYISNCFIQGNITIKEIITNKIIKLNIIINEREKNNNIELNLIYNNINKDFIINKLYKENNEYKNKCNYLEKENNELKEELTKIKNEIEQIKLNQINNNSINNSNKNQKIDSNKDIFNNFKLNSELTKNSYCSNNINNTFIVFNSINSILYLVYSTYIKSIISFDLITQKINLEIKNAHKNYITNFRYCFDKANKKDIIMSVSDIDNNLKLWDANNWECILNLENINKQGFLNSAYFLNDKNNIYIISSNWNFKNAEKIKVFNIKGEKIKEINDSDDKAVFITSFYDIKKLKYYIITGNDRYIRS